MVTIDTCNLPFLCDLGGGLGTTALPKEEVLLLTTEWCSAPTLRRAASGENGRWGPAVGGGVGARGGGGVLGRHGGGLGTCDIESRISTLVPTPSIISGNICNTKFRYKHETTKKEN